MSKITASMGIPEIIEQYPDTRPVFERFGFHLDVYKAMAHESLSASARVHRVEVEELLSALNQALNPSVVD